MEDEEIVELYLKRDENAIKETAMRYGSRLKSLAYGIVGDVPTAEECENDTYMEAWASIPPNEPRTYLYAFLARITRHIAMNCCRGRNALKRSAYISELSKEMEECIPSPDDTQGAVDSILLGEAISRFLQKQPEDKRNIFMRRYWYLDTVEDIAERFHYGKSKVKSLLFRSRRELKEYLKKEGYEL